MLVDDLKNVVLNQNTTNPFLLRNQLKEVLQGYVLNYIYSTKFGDELLFKGGTCLRFCFDLPRLSEDIDLDIKTNDFNLDEFILGLNDYFSKTLQYRQMQAKTAGNGHQIRLLFPILQELGLVKSSADSEKLFLRLDLSLVDRAPYTEETSLKNVFGFNYIIRRYSLEDLFASKLAAILTRTFRKGKGATFKGRDYFDLIWFMEKGVTPNRDRLCQIIGNDNYDDILREVDSKVKLVNTDYLKEDLLPLFDNTVFVDQFCHNFASLYQGYRKILEPSQK